MGRSNTGYFNSNYPNVENGQRQLKSRLLVCSKEGEYKSKDKDKLRYQDTKYKER